MVPMPNASILKALGFSEVLRRSRAPSRWVRPFFHAYLLPSPNHHPAMSSDPIHPCPKSSHTPSISITTSTEDPLGVRSTPEIEKKYVHSVYDAIAPHFSSTRFAKWPKVAAFLDSLPSGSLVLDAGCGNGKYLGFNPLSFYIGCDISAPLVAICAERGHEAFVADAVHLPYRSALADAAISIAVLHHLSTEARRRKAVEELVRVVRPGGLVLVTVWAVEQEDRSLLRKWTPLGANHVDEEWIGPSEASPREPKSSPSTALEVIPEHDDGGGNLGSHQEYFVPWHLPYHRAEIGGASSSALASGLAKKDDRKGAVVYNRYYHVFAEGELQRLVSDIEDAAVVDQFFDKSNWCIILKKT